MFNDHISDRKIPAYPGNGEIRIRWFNPPILLPELDEFGDPVIVDGIPQLKEFQFIVEGNVEVLDEDGALFGTRQIDGARLPENIRVLAGAIAEEATKVLVANTPNVQMAVAPKHESRITPFEQQYGKAVEKRKQALDKLAEIKQKAEAAKQRRQQAAEFADEPPSDNPN